MKLMINRIYKMLREDHLGTGAERYTEIPMTASSKELFPISTNLKCHK